MHAFRAASEANDAKKRVDIRDESGERVIAGRRSTGRGVITEQGLKREVSRDLDALMNAINLGSSIDLESFPYVSRSVLNHGFPDVTHRSIDETSVADIRGEIAEVLANFEPRLNRNSLKVARDTSVDAVSLKTRFIVQADLCSDPVDVPVEFVAEVELDTGKIVINRL